MRKLSVVLIMVVVLAFSLPAMAQNPFADVPAHHWAYDAVTQAVAGGIITGFPDGTYKGTQNLTRYEVAMIIARILDAIEQERRVLLQEMESSDASLATSIEAMEAMIEADMGALAENLGMEVSTVKRALTADMDVLQADLSTYVDALEARLKAQMGAVESQLGGKVDAVEAKVDGVASDVAAVDAKVYAVDEKVVDVLEQLGEIDFWLDVLYDKVDYVDARVDDVAADVSAVDGKVAAVAADVADVDGKVAGVVADVSAVDAKVINVAAEVGALKAKMNELETDLMYVAEDLDLYFDYLVDLEFWVDVLYDEMDYVAVRLGELSEKLDAVDAKVDGVAADFDRKLAGLEAALSADVAAVDSKVDALSAEVDKKLAELAAEVEAAKVVDVSDEVAAIEAMIRDAAAKSAAVDAKVDALAADVDALAAEMAAGRAAMDAKVDGVAARVDAVEAEMDVYAEMFGELDFWVDILFGELDDVASKIDGVAADVAAVDARVRGVAASVDAVDSKVDALAVKVDGVDAKVDAVEARTADMALQLGEMEEDILARIAKTQRELSAAQATQVVAIVERILERQEPDVTKVEVMGMMESLNALINEFNDELTEVLGDMDRELSALRFVPAHIVDLQKKTADLEDRVAALEDPFLKFSAKTSVEFQAKDFQGLGYYYKDPFNTLDADDKVVRYDETKQYFRQTVDLGMHLQREGVTADLKLQLVGNVFSLGDRDVLEMVSLSGVVENEDFRAEIKRDHGYTLTSYLFNKGDAKYDGMVVTVGNNKYGLFGDDDVFRFGMSHGLDLFLPVTLYLGIEDTIDAAQITTDRNVLVGFKVDDIRLAIFDVTANYAFSRGELGDYHLNIVGKTSFLNDRLDFTADYLLRDADFRAIEGAQGEAHRLNLTTAVTFHPVNLSLKNNLNLLTDVNTHTFRAEVKEENAMRFAGFSNFGHLEIASSNDDDLAGHSRYFKAFRSFISDKMKFAAIYEHLTGAVADNTYVDDRTEKDEFRLEADYDLTEKIDFSAKFRHNMFPADSQQEFTLEANWDFTTAIDFYARVFVPSYADNQLTLKGTYESSIFAGNFDASATKHFNRFNDALILDANFQRDTFYRLFGYDLNLGAGLMFRNEINDNYLNLYAGLDTEKELTERLSVNAASKLDKRDWVPNRKGDDPFGNPLSGEGGLLITHSLGLDYEIFADAVANLKYKYLDYRSNAAGNDEDYVGSVITGGFSISF